jgi:hypothetical protein
MLLTKKRLNKLLYDWRITIPDELKQELLTEYGNPFIDDEGHTIYYTEQDVCEQIRKKVCPYKNSWQGGVQFS